MGRWRIRSLVAAAERAGGSRTKTAVGRMAENLGLKLRLRVIALPRSSSSA